MHDWVKSQFDSVTCISAWPGKAGLGPVRLGNGTLCTEGAMRTESVSENQLVSAWRRALHYILETGATPGAAFKTRLLYEVMGLSFHLPMDLDESVVSYNRRNTKNQLAFAGLMRELRDALLEDHCVDLQATGRGEYVVIPPTDQRKRAVGDYRKTVRKAADEATLRVRHVDPSVLDANERKLQADALAHIDQLRRMAGGRKR